METLLARYRNITVLALAIFAQLLLLGYQIRSDRDVRLIRVWGVTAITPVARVVHGVHESVAALWSNYIWLRGARQQNERLRAEIGRLKLENQALRNSLEAAERLKILTAYQQNILSETTVASVIGAGANPNSRVIFLDKGAGSGVKTGMAVITPDGIVGRVQSVFPGSSLVQLIDDTNSAVGVILETSRAHGILKGAGLNEGRIDYVPNEEKVDPGERVYTSGEDRIYPKGLLAGIVLECRQGRDFKEITVRSAARLDRLEEVLVVMRGVHQDLPRKVPKPGAPEVLLPPPPIEDRDGLSGLSAPRTAVAGGAGPAGSAPSLPADGSVAGTDADRVKRRYEELGAMQGHKFGEGAPGSKPPDFNLGWSPQGGMALRRPPAAKPPGPSGSADAPGSGAGSLAPRVPGTNAPPQPPDKPGAAPGSVRP
jgi:rod shape-determining protein MreC